ncbi:MAG TPA: hypothetical protein VMC85_06140 [Desulfomonilaceae bacterium]|nr:hypothetical protein [Desulfomonilaceae bacterium]
MTALRSLEMAIQARFREEEVSPFPVLRVDADPATCQHSDL